jgi:hypothetical protein
MDALLHSSSPEEPMKRRTTKFSQAGRKQGHKAFIRYAKVGEGIREE